MYCNVLEPPATLVPFHGSTCTAKLLTIHQSAKSLPVIDWFSDIIVILYHSASRRIRPIRLHRFCVEHGKYSPESLQIFHILLVNFISNEDISSFNCALFFKECQRTVVSNAS